MTMYCPACGQERTSTETIYCSRCGYLLTGTAELLAVGGAAPSIGASSGLKARTPRNRGLKQGLFIFLLTFLIVPLITIFTVAVHAPPFAVIVAAILLSVGGLLRMAYAMMFESNEDNEIRPMQPQFGVGPTPTKETTGHGLPPQQTYPASGYVSPGAGNWRDTNDLQPASVTDSTTRHLEKLDADQ